MDCGCEQYADTYAQEDVRVALQEARAAGVEIIAYDSRVNAGSIELGVSLAVER